MVSCDKKTLLPLGGPWPGTGPGRSGLVKSTGLYIYRFLSADTIIPNPNDSQSYNRYTYVRNNPIGLVDPSGHIPELTECGTNGDQCNSQAPENHENDPEIDWIEVLQEHAGFDAISLSFFLPADDVSDVLPAYVGINTQVSAEILMNIHTGDITVYLVLSAGFEARAGNSASIAGVSLVFNIGDDNLAYAGPFNSVGLSGSYGAGLDASYAWTKGDTPWDPSLAYSITFIPTLGTEAGISVQESEYIPILTVSNGQTTYHATEYLYETVPQRMQEEFLSSVNQLTTQLSEFYSYLTTPQ